MVRLPRRRSALPLFAGIGLFYAAIFGAHFGFQSWVKVVHLQTLKADHYHYDFITARLWTRNLPLLKRWQREGPPKVWVRRRSPGGAGLSDPLTTVGGLREVSLEWDGTSHTWLGRWPCPWNAPEGTYELSLDPEGEPGLERWVQSQSFRILKRRPRPLPERFVVLTYEDLKPLSSLKVKTPGGTTKDWRGLLDWAEHIGADAFWMVAGATPGEAPGEVWIRYNLALLPEVARECKRRGLKFGVWAMCYLTVAGGRTSSRYEYAVDYQDGVVGPTRAISIRDPRRPADLADFLRRMQDIPGVDFLGLDYIRNPLGGYELIEDFYREMPGVSPPAGWERWSPQERIAYFARKKIMRRDPRFIEAWQWWRARRVALIAKYIKGELGDSKSLWAFTLSWQMGWHHGQDPVMMNDAGVDVLAIMLYEANEAQFSQMMRDWPAYMRTRDAQLIVGDVVDWPLHQRSPKGPEAMYERIARGVDRIYGDGPARGIFIHDLARALWGRTGPYSTTDWMDQAARAVRHYEATVGRRTADASVRKDWKP